MAQSPLVNWDTLKWDRTRPWLGTVVRIALGVIWIWAAESKLREPRQFVQAVRAYDATPEWLSKTIGYGLPVLEFSIGVVLVIGVAVRLAAIASAALFAVFLVGIIQAGIRGIALECGCFGGGGATSGGNTNYTWDILRDLGLVLLAAFLIWAPFTRISLDEFIGRKDYVEPPSKKRLRTEDGRRKYNALLESRRREARSRNRYIAGSLAGIIVLISLIGIGVQSGRAKIEGSLTATNASVSSGIVYGKKAAATVDVYEDFQCPNCRDYEQKVGTTMRADVAANKVQVRFHVLSFLDASSSGARYSSRAANAGYCASDVSVDAFVKFHTELFDPKVQPAEGGTGLTDAKLISYGQKAGISGTALTDFTSCVTDEKHSALVQAITDRATQDGVNGTPTVKINGKTVDNSLDAFTKAVDEALKKGPAPSPSPTPSTPTVSPSSTAPAGSTTPSKSGSSSSKP